MGQVNLYKIDGNKKKDFLDKLFEKFEFLGKKAIIRWLMKKMFIP